MHRLKYISVATSLALGVSALGAGVAMANDVQPTYTVTINKYVDGAPANASSTKNAAFAMKSSWNDSVSGGGSGTYTLGPTGFNSSTPYQAVTSPLSKGSSYTTSEDTSGSMVGTSCESGKPYALVGYSTGTSAAAAASASTSAGAPTFWHIGHNEFVDVWNKSCATAASSSLSAPTNLSPTNGQTLTSAQFTSASWTGVNDSAGGISYVFQSSNSSTTDQSGAFTNPIYTSQPLSTTSISTANTPEGTYFWHVMATDSNGTKSPWSQTTSFTINNATSSSTGGTNSGGIGGTVNTSQGTLAVTSIEPVQTTASADNSYADGWKYIFDVTVPTDETNVAMAFSNWLGSNASNTIPVAGNMRISSAQADNGGAHITLTGVNVFSSPLHITKDLNPSMPGDQIKIEVDVKIPVGTANDQYLTNYTVQSNP